VAVGSVSDFISKRVTVLRGTAPNTYRDSIIWFIQTKVHAATA